MWVSLFCFVGTIVASRVYSTGAEDSRLDIPLLFSSSFSAKITELAPRQKFLVEVRATGSSPLMGRDFRAKEGFQIDFFEAQPSDVWIPLYRATECGSAPSFRLSPHKVKHAFVSSYCDDNSVAGQRAPHEMQIRFGRCTVEVSAWLFPKWWTVVLKDQSCETEKEDSLIA